MVVLLQLIVVALHARRGEQGLLTALFIIFLFVSNILFLRLSYFVKLFFGLPDISSAIGHQEHSRTFASFITANTNYVYTTIDVALQLPLQSTFFKGTPWCQQQLAQTYYRANLIMMIMLMIIIIINSDAALVYTLRNM